MLNVRFYKSPIYIYTWSMFDWYSTKAVLQLHPIGIHFISLLFASWPIRSKHLKLKQLARWPCQAKELFDNQELFRRPNSAWPECLCKVSWKSRCFGTYLKGGSTSNTFQDLLHAFAKLLSGVHHVRILSGATPSGVDLGYDSNLWSKDRKLSCAMTWLTVLTNQHWWIWCFTLVHMRWNILEY